MRYDIAGLKSALGSIAWIDDPARLKTRSRDFYWYSPILRDQLEHVRAELVVLPRDEAEVIATLAACHARAIPVTPRGAGTGNYGQAMPLEGGVVLDLSGLANIVSIENGVARAQCGARLIDLDARATAESRQALRMFPSTLRNATLGGFICGGSGGVGSITWGGLRDRGNVLGLRLLTMEHVPRALELRGDDVQKAIHAYGTTGVVTEVEIALAPACAWIDAIVAFDAFEAAAAFGHALACQDALLKKLVTVLAAPIADRYLRPIAERTGAGKHVVLTMIARHAFEPFAALVRASDGRIAWSSPSAHASGSAGGSIDADDRARDGSSPRRERGLPLPLYEYTWNHTTLHALKSSRDITYHQTLHPAPDPVRTAVALHRGLHDEVVQHLEFVRFDGSVACFGLPLIRFTSASRLRELEAMFEDAGCPTFSPHAVTLEDGGMKRVDPVQLAFKRETDPQGLLNPGKMRAWNEPAGDARAGRLHLFRPAPAGGGTDR